MPVTNYYTIDGSIIGEATGGVRTDYLTDALGSVTATVDSSGNLLNTYRYKPYGEQLAKTGAAADPKFTWVGTLGYRQTGRRHSDTYVRARHYGTTQGRWTTKDGLWERLSGEHPYGYAMDNPVNYTDASGLYTVGSPCGKNSVVIIPNVGDKSSIVVGPGGTMLPPSQVFPTLGVNQNSDCIAINGGFFFDAPYIPGKKATPIGNVVDCKNKTYPGSPAPNPIPVISDNGSIIGRPPNKPGGVQDGNLPRTGACVDKAGNIEVIIAIGPPGTTFGGLTDCMKKNCPPGSQYVLLDGGGSTQVIQKGKPSRPYPGFRGQKRPVHNWIVICGKQE